MKNCPTNISYVGDHSNQIVEGRGVKDLHLVQSEILFDVRVDVGADPVSPFEFDLEISGGAQLDRGIKIMLTHEHRKVHMNGDRTACVGKLDLPVIVVHFRRRRLYLPCLVSFRIQKIPEIIGINRPWGEYSPQHAQKHEGKYYFL